MNKAIYANRKKLLGLFILVLIASALYMLVEVNFANEKLFNFLYN